MIQTRQPKQIHALPNAAQPQPHALRTPGPSISQPSAPTPPRDGFDSARQTRNTAPTHRQPTAQQPTLTAPQAAPVRRAPSSSVQNPDALALQSVQKGLQLLGNGNAGPLVASLQRQLSDAGYPVEPDGIFGPKTEAAVRAFQTAHGLQIDGIVGPETSGRLLELMAIPMPGSTATVVPELELTPMVHTPAVNAASEILLANTDAGLPETSAGRALAAEASRIATMRNTTGRCYAGVADAVDAKVGRFLWGMSAYMAADQLAARPEFKEVNVSTEELSKLPAGAIVVWGKTNVSPDGHISIALGDGREASDHIDTQRTHLRGFTNFRVFIPKPPSAGVLV